MGWTIEKLKKFYEESSEILEELENIKNDSKNKYVKERVEVLINRLGHMHPQTRTRRVRNEFY